MHHVRLVAAAAGLILALAVLAACGGGTTVEKSPDGPAEQQPSEESEGQGKKSDANEATQTELNEQETPPAEETGTPQPESDSTAAEGPVEVETTVLAQRLEAPWGLAFLPNGDALVTERDTGRLLRVDSSGDIEEVQTLPEGGSGEGGLMGVAVSPDYESDEFVYAYYTTPTDNRVVRFRLGEEPEPILTGIPVASFHNGGRIAFGPDGLLYVGTGDAGQRPSSQDTNSLAGKILRLTPDGGMPSDNPLGSNNPLYSYGHRNVQGLAWDANGQLFASEFGQNTYDEVNRIVPGGNYGWPDVEGEGGASQGYIDPIATVTPTSELSPSGAEILKSGAIPQWEGSFFTAGLRGQRLWRLALDESGNVTERETLLQGEAGRLRHVAQAPDGSLWILTNNRDGRGSPIPSDDRILRLAPAGG
ncbi:MAG: PQQ-dependent sugar dehydrogenase [Actinomycetota bacterium]|nr:PQQ-dependent sugar dehydrogenase [Actinomycetota bacterium]